jgi:HK97 family phage prohead protease
MDRAKFFADTPFVKSIEPDTGALHLKGYASTWTLDRDQEYVERNAFDGTIEKFLGTNPILLWQHDLEKPIGVVKAMAVDDNGLDVECFIPKPDDKEPDWTHLAYSKVKGGIVKTFSIGGFFERIHKGAKRAIQKVDLFEISVVSVPSNPDSIFAAAVKSIEGLSRPEFTVAHVQQMEQIIGMKPITDPELSMMSDDEKQARYEFLSEIYRKTGKLPPKRDAWKRVVDSKGKPIEDRTDLLLKTIREVQGKIEYDAIKAVTLSDSDESDLKSAVDGAETAIEDLEDVLTRITGIDFDADEADANGEGVSDSTKSALAVAVKGARALVTETRELLETKKGRVLSRENERRLRAMRNEIDAILAQVASADERQEEEHDGDGSTTSIERRDTEVETLEDDLAELLAPNERLADDGMIERSDDGGKSWVPVWDSKARPTNLRKGDGDRMCSNCIHWRAPGGNTSRAGYCRKYNYPTRGDQLSDGFSAKGDTSGGKD